MAEKLVSVIIPSYNHAAYISEAVSSVLSQSLTHLELIVVDDGSQDETLEILAGFSDKRLLVYRQSNQGAHAAINRGLHMATGNYLAILNSDDAYHPQRLEKLVGLLENDPSIVLAGSHIQLIDQRGRPLGVKHGYLDCEPWLLENPQRSFRAGTDLRAALLTENYFATTSNLVFSRGWFEQAGDFRPLRFTHDWDYALRLAGLGELALLPEPLLRYRLHPTNTIRQDQATMLFEICWILAVHLPNYDLVSSASHLPPLETRIDQLLNSIYTAQCERVLSVMLLQGLHDHLDQALRLLVPDDPVRAAYLRYIQQRLHQGTQASSNLNPSKALGRLRSKLGQVKHKVEHGFRRLFL
jgi:glycosyltransferase involved in cell wall biosynthesis